MKRLIAFVACILFAISTAFSAEQPIHVFLIGPGLVGKELLHQIKNKSHSLACEVRVVGLANSHKMCFDPQGIDLAHWQERLAGSDEALSLQTFIERMVGLQMPHSIFVDCTSAQTVADVYGEVLQGHISIVTPNKKANSGTYATYCDLKKLGQENQVKFLYDANVGAGLPLIRTIQSLRRSGDSIVKIQAVLSGTLSYLFNTYDGTVPFSKVLREAQEKGYTEPDPRDDLNGMDMARKFLILAREAGFELEMKDIDVEKFLSNECFDAPTVAKFYERLADFDQVLAEKVMMVKQNGQVLRFIGMLKNGKAKVALKAVGPEHPFYSLTDTDNIASIKTRNYSNNPIVIKGPGAGATVTAASVLANIIEAGTTTN